MNTPSLLHNTIAVESREAYRLWVAFDDGTAGIVDFSEWKPFRGVLAPLSQIEIFSKVYIHPEYKTLVWPTDIPVDVDPVWLYCRANNLPIPQWT